ncbi:MAG: hypothetical protein V1818_01585 [Candidatus Aenigmatarchaeota archaeon]
MVDVVSIVQQIYTFFYSLIAPIIGETYLQLFVTVLALSVYAVFVWKFYRTLSKRDIFKINLEKYNLPDTKHKNLRKAGSIFAYILKYGVIFPFYIIIWFVILSLLMLLMTVDATVGTVLMLSISIVSATRLLSYYSEDLSTDIAKLIPFGLMAVSLTGSNFFSIETTIARLSEVPLLWSSILQFLIFSIVLEWMLRILYLIKRGNEKRKAKDTQ